MMNVSNKLLIVFMLCATFANYEAKKKNRNKLKSLRNKDGINPVVQIPEGQIEGHTLLARQLPPAENHKPFWYYAFEGIPYGAPPIGPLRFKDPVPVKPWLGSRKCVSSTIQCVDDYGVGVEDCLTLSVYTPQLPQPSRHLTKLLPVLFFIYGGGFTHGNASFGEYAPDFMIRTGIVIVTANYRVGPFGFLTTADSAIPGNAGLKDQLLALKWVKRNIEFFSGDSNKVTLVGESAGGASVHLHLMSHLSNGLFNRAISESSTGISGWATTSPTLGRKQTYDIARRLNIKANNTHDLANQLRRVDATTLVKATYVTDLNHSFPIMSPVVEAKGSTMTPFLLKDPYDIAKSCRFNNVTYIIGVNTGEGILFGNLVTKPKLIPDAYLYYLQNYVAALFGLNAERTEELVDDVTRFYFGNNTPSLLTFSSFIDVISDSMFTYSVMKTVVIQRRCQNIFVYQFSFLGKFTFGADMMNGILTNVYNLPPIQKVCHGDELGYYWYRIPILGVDTYPLTSTDSIDRKIVYRMVTMWSSFVKYGNPNVFRKTFGLDEDWPVSKYLEKGISYLNIEKNLTIVKGKIPFEERMLFWVKMQRKYGKDPNIFDELINN